MKTSLTINGFEVPRLIYGTAWKEERTQQLATLALQNGFRGIDTANQRRHYVEAAVGQAIADSIASGQLVRDDLFVQTKFTFPRGQDHRLPYDPDAPISKQVMQSFASSLEHLNVERIDSYLLHGPTRSAGLTDDDWAAWRAMETLQNGGQVRMIGVSNVNLEQLRRLCDDARVRPSFVQNRCYATSQWDRQIRNFCIDNGMIYQGFSLLTANRDLLASAKLKRIANSHNRTIPQVVFRFAIDVGMMALTGTSDADHMCEDLDIFGFQLSHEEIEQIEGAAAG